MQDSGPQKNKTSAPDKMANKGHGPQGVDKAPGEEPAEDNVQFTQQTQKGKKVDADITQESDLPIEQDDKL